MNTSNIAGIILAAGGSSRLGRPKQLLDWFGKTFIVKVIETALEVKLSQLIVVTGAYHEEVISKIQGYDIQIIHNWDWQKGQSSSLIAGIQSLNQDIEKVIFFLCDQPQVSSDVVKKIVIKSEDPDFTIVTAGVGDRNCPPILFKKGHFPELLKLRGDQGGRELINKYSAARILSDDDRLILDTDTMEDYEKLISAFKL